jgi:hypothetical protein
MKKIMFLSLVLVLMAPVSSHAVLDVNTAVAQKFYTGQVTITNAATLIKGANTYRHSIVLYNSGAVDCYLGYTSAVLTTTGFILKAGTGITLDRSEGDIYAITASSTTVVQYLEE